jgi:signal transduction histidine kinase
MASVVFIATIIYFFEKNESLKDMDKRLEESIEISKMMFSEELNRDYRWLHDLNASEEENLIAKAGKLATFLDIAYISTFIQSDDGRIRYIFSSTPSNRATDRNSSDVRYYDEYTEAEDFMSSMFHESRYAFEEIINSRGHFRTAMNSYAARNSMYRMIIAVDIDMKVVDELYAEKLKNVFYTAITILGFFVLLSRRSIRANLEKISEIHQINRVLTDLNSSLEERVEAALEEQKEHLDVIFAQSRHAQMGELISMIAHQWRQPLARISMNMSKLKLYHELDKLDEKEIDGIALKVEEISTYLSQTIDDFRSFLHADQDSEDISYDAVVNKALSLVSSFSDEGIQIEFDLKTPEEHHISANNLVQVLINILNNAREALIEECVENPKIIIKSIQTSPTVSKISIEDNAGGIPMEIIGKIFDPYFSTKMEKHGTGLGMYMSRKIIEEQFFGEINVRNSHQGAVFIITLKEEE